MIDGYPNPVTKPNAMTQEEYVKSYSHGITTFLTASRYAQGANLFLVDGNGMNDNKFHEALSNVVP